MERDPKQNNTVYFKKSIQKRSKSFYYRIIAVIVIKILLHCAWRACSDDVIREWRRTERERNILSLTSRQAVPRPHADAVVCRATE